ncbi:MAG TPA: hypothetical protein DDY82_00750 [Clostridiales bacterium]|nr:hypothetical protein [Clostridiales bacterium]
MEGLYENLRDNEQQICYFETETEFFSHFHSSIEINYALSPVLIQHNENFLEVEKNNFVFQDSYDIHSNKNGTIAVLIIPKKYLSNFIAFKKNLKLKDFLFKDDNGEILNLIRQFNDLKNKNQLEIQGLVDYCLGKIISKTKLAENKSVQDSPLICQIIKYLNENYKQKITLDSLSDYFGYSRSHISHTISEYLNCNLNTYLNKIRLINYIELTKSNSEKIITNCYECGFDSLQTFYRNFKKVYNTSPFNYFKKQE